MNAGWIYAIQKSVCKFKGYENLIQLDASFEAIVHIGASGTTSGRKVFLLKHGPGVCRSPAEVADRLGYLIPGATADARLARTMDPFVSDAK